jgi:ATP-dependent Lon protease
MRPRYGVIVGLTLLAGLVYLHAQALRKADRIDPVLVLNEIDKDHYPNVPIDLSQILFIYTADTLDTISPPLLDWCEIIQLSGYMHNEKLHIARRFILPKHLAQNGLLEAHVELVEPAPHQTVTHYTQEAGVRSLERAIGGIVRYEAVEWAAYVDKQGLIATSFTSTVGNLESAVEE